MSDLRPYIDHASWVEFSSAGLPFCGLCAPSPRRCHICQSESGLEPGKSGDGRWWCSDYEACNERARRRLRKGPRP